MAKIGVKQLAEFISEMLEEVYHPDKELSFSKVRNNPGGGKYFFVTHEYDIMDPRREDKFKKRLKITVEESY